MHRVGLGHDTHRLGPGLPLVLGGVTVPHEAGCIAHSDGDVLLHAITDALLGATALGDIGEWFPDTDPQHSVADSANLLTRVVNEVHGRGWRVVNLDCTAFAPPPNLSNHQKEIAVRVAELLGLTADRVCVKA